MEMTEYVLLTEKNVSYIMHTICLALGIEYENASCLTAKGSAYEFDLCVVGAAMDEETVEFFDRQIDYIYMYVKHNGGPPEVLAQIKDSASLVIFYYVGEYEDVDLRAQAAKVVTALLKEHHGLHLTKHGVASSLGS